MTQEDKELLLTDLCARTLYGVICLNKVTKEVYKLCYVTSYNEISLDDRTAIFYSPDDIIPYLRPMSSMTEEERLDLASIGVYIDKGDIIFDAYDYRDISLLYIITPYINWLNQHHFDYRDLISKGLALEAPKDMYI